MKRKLKVSPLLDSMGPIWTTIRRIHDDIESLSQYIGREADKELKRKKKR